MNTYFIAARTSEGDSLDWFVNAETPERACELWRENVVDFTDDTYSEEILTDQEYREDEDARVFQINPNNVSVEGLIGWHGSQVPLLGYMKWTEA